VSTRSRTTRTAAVAGAAALALTLAACSSSSSGSEETSAAASSTPASSSAAPSASAAPPASAGPQSADELGAIDPATLPATIPFTDVSDHIVVEAGFGTDETFSMMLDTGAPLNVSEDMVSTLGLPVVSTTTSNAGGGTVESNVIAAETVTIGDLTVNQVFGISPWVGSDNPLSCVTENGLVGANVMSQGVWQIDYQAKTVTVTETTDGIDHVTDAIPVQFLPEESVGRVPLTVLGLGNGQLPFVIDTGSNLGIVAGPKELASVGIEFGPDAPTQKAVVFGAAGTQEQEIPYITTTVDAFGTKFDFPVGAIDIIPARGTSGTPSSASSS
jgi:Aspartyl protease